jgi:hypothetical protein
MTTNTTLTREVARGSTKPKESPLKPTPLLLTCLIGLAFPTAGLPQPTITIQPKNQSVSLGAQVTFDVRASGTSPFGYQWRYNDAAIPGATGISLVLTNIQLANAGTYTAVVTDALGSTTSQPATLEVDPTFTKITTGPVVTERSSFISAAWGDFDGDGYLDLAAAAFRINSTAFEAVHLYRNNGPGPNGFTFTKITTGTIATNLVNGSGLAWGDYDNDGQLDLFVANDGARNLLFRNTGNGTFIKTTNAPFASDLSHGDNAAWADYNQDGYLDLFVANHDLRNLFYQNNGDGTFKKLTSNEVGSMLADVGFMASVAWADYDNDGDPDLFITRPLNNGTSLLYRNNGDGTFQSMAKKDVGDIVNDSGGSSGSSWGDYDNDGDLDLFVAVGSEALGTLLWRNNGNGTFSRMSTNEVGAIVGEPGGSVSGAWADYDNDGWLDLFVTRPGKDNLLYRNNGDGTFAKVAAGSPVHDSGNGSGLAWGDFDNDGFMDLFVCNGFNPSGNFQESNFLYRNNGNTNHWLKLVLVGTVSNRSAIGAKVRVKATSGGKTFLQLREISGSGNRYSFQDMRPNFGLGDATVAETVRIEWPSGIVQELQKVAPNQILTVTEPSRLQVLGAGAFRVQSWKGMAFEVQASTDLKQWSPVTTVTNLSGTLELTDPDAANHLQRFYRVSVK